MIRTLQLYIGTDRVELFEDEEITITDSIKNSKDIAKVFTTFSKQFTVPASKSNNKIFKHYYNFDILDGFDARKKVDARIELNHIPYKKGKIKLEGVDLKNNKAYAYRITFYGSVVDLKDLLGEDKLPQLDAFQGVSKPYDINSLISDLQQINEDGYNLALITAGQRLYYDTDNPSQGSGNIHYNGTTAQGLKPQQLKYGVKLKKIVDAIADHYDGITFADNTFFTSELNDLNDLYMWLHRKKDTIEIISGADTEFVFDDTFGETYFNITDNVVTIEEDPSADEELVFTTVATSSARYDVILRKNDNEIVRVYEGLTGNFSDSFTNTNFTAGDEFTADIKVYEQNATFSSVKWDYRINTIIQQDEFATQLTYTAGFAFGISENMPEMKVIDFLSGLFKLFNLVAYVEDGEIVTKTLDEFYREGVEYDISKFVDINSARVDVALPFSEIFFKYKDTGTILAEQHLQTISNVEWGGIEYNNNTSNLSGDIYKVEPPFNHTKYERLINGSNSLDVTNVQVGYFVTDNEEAYLGDPLIYYIVPQESNIRISFTRDGALVNSPSLSGTINMPSNSLSFNAATSEENIHFNAELNEYTGTAFEETLFKRYYQKYIENIFNSRNRLLKITAQLPIGITQKLRLNDTLTINNRKFYINSMNINLSTGKTDLELINKYEVNAVWEQVEELWSNIDTNWSTI